MKRWIALLLALTVCAGLTACSPSAPPRTTEKHKIGVIVYDTGDEEVIGFREYLQGYIESNFEMVQFLYSESIGSREEELDFLQRACDDGAEGFLSFLTYDLAAEVALCQANGAYYLLASGTVSDQDYDAVADNPWFLGTFGPGQPYEFQAGADMARHFIRRQVGNRYFILSGAAAQGNEMHYQRTLGVLDALSSAYGAYFPMGREALAAVRTPTTVETEKLTVTVCPGYVNSDTVLRDARDAFRGGEYDAVLSVLPPLEMVSTIGRTPLAVVDSYNTRNLQLFTGGQLELVIGKYNSMIGPAFALLLNAVTGHAADFRDNGKAVKVTQGFWVSDSRDDYSEKYALSTSASMNAYNFDDLSHVICLFNPDANLNDLVALAEACSFRAVQSRRSAG